MQQGMPWWKCVSNPFLTRVENRAFGLKLSEIHTGYRAFRWEVLESVNYTIDSDGFVFDQEIIAQVAAARLRIAEIGVPMRYLPEASSAGFGASVVYGLKILWLMFRFVLYRWRLCPSKQFEALGSRYKRVSVSGPV